MLTGRAAFKGGSVPDTIAAVLGSEPDWDALPDGTPTGSLLNRRTFAIPVPAGKTLPDFPVGGITDLKQAGALPGTRTIEEALVSPGSDPSTYVFTKTDSQRNLFRIPLH
jgi:hypothetical protein